eukprot:TRINITY_DN18150_c0_g1_i1.p1 TRINITY_DN18150_c0_g1~~TRINITY_DN18150_c0_g1_i1.p1  ORF type:complete len:1183 (+),score=265.25 TRINITY_DN18150_c0_g1_i1:81-3551(+)
MDARARNKPTCQRCIQLAAAPLCRACGQPVRFAPKGHPEPYHAECRRCSSCSLIIPYDGVHRLAGKLLCLSCARMFNKCFVANPIKADVDYMKCVFGSWNHSGDGKIAKEELRRVLLALNPDFADRDLSALMRAADKNCSGLVEFNEFCDWIMGQEPLRIPESFEVYLTGFMQDAGQAEKYSKRGIAEIQVRPNGLVFVTRGGEEQHQSSCCRSDSVDLTTLDGEEFIVSMECNEDGLIICMNTGRRARLQTDPLVFGPWVAPEGFHIVGLRTKRVRRRPSKQSCGSELSLAQIANDRIVGVRLAPLPAASHYEPTSSLLFVAEHGYLLTLREVLAKGAVDVNSFGIGGVTPLMLAAEHGDPETMRLLITCKASINMADAEGWTALTFACEYGNHSAEEFLRRKGATQEGDGGSAFVQSQRARHNAAARAELRHSWGQPPTGTFRLEQVADAPTYKLEAPRISPEGGAFAEVVTVKLTVGEVPDSEKSRKEKAREAKRAAEQKAAEEALTAAAAAEAEAAQKEGAQNSEGYPKEAKLPVAAVELAKEKAKKVMAQAQPPSDVKILYTLDGRDPTVAGKRYTGPIIVDGHHVTLRAVAVSASRRWRSNISEAVYSVCHYVLPAEVVFGSCTADIFPEAVDLLRNGVAEVLDAPKERVLLNTSTISSVGDQRWLSLQVVNPKPKQRLILEQKYATIRKNEKMAKQFLDKVLKDLSHKKACNIKPENTNIVEVNKKVALDFVLPQAPAVELATQLMSPDSYLKCTAKLRNLWKDARLEAMDLLRDRLDSHALREELQFSFGKKIKPEAIAGLGQGDHQGVVAFKVANAKEGKKVKNSLAKAMKECLPAAVADDPPKESPGQREFDYTIDLLRDPDCDGSQVSELISSQTFLDEVTEKLTQRIPTTVELRPDIQTKRLKQVKFDFGWRAAPVGPLDIGLMQDHPDIVCLVYSRSKLVGVVDTKSAEGIEGGGFTDLSTPDGAKRSFPNINIVADSNGALHVSVNIEALSPSVTEIYFALSAFEVDDFGHFLEPTVKVHDDATGRLLSSWTGPNCQKNADVPTKSLILCSMSWTQSQNWAIRTLGTYMKEGSARDISPFQRMLEDHQAHYDRWLRREPLVKLRVLHQLKWLSRSSTNHFAQLLWQVLDLPLPVFQVLCSWL